MSHSHASFFPLPKGALVLAAGLAACVLAQAQTNAWSAAGSTGVVDDSGYNPVKFTLTDGSAFVKTSTSGSRSVTLRYNIDSLPFSLNPPFVVPVISLRYLDNSTVAGASRVQVTLKSVNMSNGLGNHDEASFDSDTRSASNSTQLAFMSTCGVTWDFADKDYYLEVTLTADRSKQSDAIAQMQQLRIEPGLCTP